MSCKKGGSMNNIEIENINKRIETIRQNISDKNTELEHNAIFKYQTNEQYGYAKSVFKASVFAHIAMIAGSLSLCSLFVKSPNVTNHKKIDLSSSEVIEEDNIYNYESNNNYESVLTITSPWTYSTEENKYYRNKTIFTTNNKYDISTIKIEDIKDNFSLEQNNIQYKDKLDTEDDTINTSIILDEFSYEGKDTNYKRNIVFLGGAIGFTLGFLPYFLYVDLKKYSLYKSNMKRFNKADKQLQFDIKKLSSELYSLIIEKERIALESISNDNKIIRTLTK